MSKTLTIKCPTCGHTFDISYDGLQANRVIYRNEGKVELYHIRCPKCDDQIVIEIEVEATDD